MRVRECLGKALTGRVSVERIMMKMRGYAPRTTNRKPSTTIQSALELIAGLAFRSIAAGVYS